MEFRPYQLLKQKSVNVLPVLEFNLIELLKSIKRKITIRVLIRNPRCICTNITIHHSIFFEWYRAIRDFVPTYGREINVTRQGRRGQSPLKTVEIVFTHLGTLTHHLSSVVTKVTVKDYLQKKLAGGSKGQLVVNSDSPAIIKYDVNKNNMTFTAKYIVLNRYGNQV